MSMNTESPAQRPGGADRGSDQGPDARRPRRGGRYAPRRKVCSYCVDHLRYADYKDVSRLSRYISDRGKIDSRRKSGTCAKHQRSLAVALKRARFLALMPYTSNHIRP